MTLIQAQVFLIIYSSDNNFFLYQIGLKLDFGFNEVLPGLLVSFNVLDQLMEKEQGYYYKR